MFGCMEILETRRKNFDKKDNIPLQFTQGKQKNH